MSRLLTLLLVAFGSIATQSAEPAAPAEPARVAGSLIEIKRDAEAGHRKAQKLLADNFRTLEKYAAAEHWYRAAAVQGDASALCALGELYHANRGGGTNFVRANPTNAIILHRLAALQGYDPAHLYLFYSLRDGKGVARDVTQAYMHLLVSETGDREKLAREMVLVMTQEQIAEAERRAKAFQPTNFVKAFEELVFEGIHITGTMGTEQERVAFINGGVVAPGGTLRIRVAGLPAVIKCTAISKDAVTFSFNGTQRAIPFRRPNPTLVKATPGLTAR